MTIGFHENPMEVVMAGDAGNLADAGMLARQVVRQLDAARTCIGEIAAVVSAKDLDRLAAIVLSLYSAWGSAEIALARLESMFVDEAHHRFARDALSASRALASLPLAWAWRLLRRGEPIQGSDSLGGGAGGGELAKNTGDETKSATEGLLGAVLRQMDLANACLCELEAALMTGNRENVIVAAAALHRTWVPAEAAVATLRRRAAHPDSSRRERWHYKLARNAVLAWRYFSHGPLTRMWVLLQTDRRARSPTISPGAELNMEESTRPDRPDPRAAAGYALVDVQRECEALRAALEQQADDVVEVAANAVASAWLVAQATIRMLEKWHPEANDEIRAAESALRDALQVINALFAEALTRSDAPKVRSALHQQSERIRIAIMRDGRGVELRQDASPARSGRVLPTD